MIIEQLEEKKDFSNAEKVIADYFLRQGEKIQKLSARSIAAELYVAPSAISRTCQKMGFDGYNSFRDAYLEELKVRNRDMNGVNVNQPFQERDSLMTVSHKIASLYKETVDDVISMLDPEMLERAVAYCAQAKNIYITASGPKVHVAAAFGEKMARIGKTVIVMDFMNEAFYHAYHSDPEDCFIILSYSGETPVMSRMVNILHRRKSHAILVTSYGSNTFSRLIKTRLYMSSRESISNSAGDYSAPISDLFILDLLYSGVYKKNYQKNKQKIIEVTEGFELYRHSDNPLFSPQK